jgi:hypothetical protein
MPSTLDTVLSNDQLPGFETTSSMARRSGALAAVNGDYARESGRPVYAFARDGHLDQTSLSWGRNFSITASETASFIGHPRLQAWSEDTTTGVVRSIDRVNAGAPAYDEVAMFTPAGSYEERPPRNACSVRLYPAETPRLRSPEPGVEAIHTIDEVVCRARRMTVDGGVVLSAQSLSPRALEITSLVPGAQLTIGWSLGWVEVLDTVGGNPTLIEDGLIQWGNVRGNHPFLRRHPRTGVGTTADGRVLLVTVDGRQPGYSVGMTLERFAVLFRDLGATWALNLDGGGSTTFVLRGRVRNRPSDGRERPVSSALVLLPGADPGEVAGAPPPAPLDGGERARVWRGIRSDPASTGGLAGYLDSFVRENPR